MLTLIIICGVLFAFFIFLYGLDNKGKGKKRSEEEIRLRRQELFEKFQREAEEKDVEGRAFRQEIKEKYGESSKEIEFPSKLSRKYNKIMVFSESKTILIQNRPYKFSDILGHQLMDDSTTVSAGGSFTQDSNTLGTIGRAVAGGVIAGGVGAVVGGMTGGKKGSISPSVSTTVHDYTLYINVKDLQNPVIEFKLGENYKLAAEIMGVLNIISADNK